MGFIDKGLFRKQSILKISVSREAKYEEPGFSQISTRPVLFSIFKDNV